MRGFLPRGWDHLVASDGTTRRVVPGVLDRFRTPMPSGRSDLGVRGMAFREVAVTEIREVLRAWLVGYGAAEGGGAGRGGPQDRPPVCGGGGRRRGWPVTAVPGS